MSVLVEEIRTLADAMFDGEIDPSGVRRLNQLLAENSTCLQAYLEMINMHGALLAEADTQDGDEAAITALREYAEASEQRAYRANRRFKIASLAAAVLVFAGLGWATKTQLFKPSLAGVIVSMSVNTRPVYGKLELGDVLQKGSVLAIQEGVITVELDNVLVDLIGPGEIRLDDHRRIRLTNGKLTATIQPGGEGFVVRTPDADVVDLGTEFSVEFEPEQGTHVAVLRGRARASLIVSDGVPSKVLELSTNRAARLNAASGNLSETTFRPALFELVHRTRGTIRTVSGQLRTPVQVPSSLDVDQSKTMNHMLVIPEKQNVILQKDLAVNTLTGHQRIPAGSMISSYLVHYDPSETVQISPRGAITFFGTIAAAIVSSEDLQATDAQFGLAETEFSRHVNRGLELDFDQIQISGDRKTASVFFGMAPPVSLDEVRILVLSE